MSDNRLPDYPDHMQPAALDACGFFGGYDQAGFPGSQAQQARRYHEPHHHRRSRNEGDGQLPQFAQIHSQVPWRSMRGLRNHVGHGYFEINFDVVRDTVINALPELLQNLTVEGESEGYS